MSWFAILVLACIIIKPIHIVWRARYDAKNPRVSQLRARQLEKIIHRDRCDDHDR